MGTPSMRLNGHTDRPQANGHETKEDVWPYESCFLQVTALVNTLQLVNTCIILYSAGDGKLFKKGENHL